MMMHLAALSAPRNGNGQIDIFLNVAGDPCIAAIDEMKPTFHSRASSQFPFVRIIER